MGALPFEASVFDPAIPCPGSGCLTLRSTLSMVHQPKFCLVNGQFAPRLPQCNLFFVRWHQCIPMCGGCHEDVCRSDCSLQVRAFKEGLGTAGRVAVVCN